MQLSYKAKYYSGQSSVPYTADVSFYATGIQIGYTDSRNEYITVEWAKAHVKETDFSSAAVILRYGEIFPYQQLEVTDHGFIQEYKTHFRISVVKRWMYFRTSGMLATILLGFIATILVGYFFVLPFIADKVAQSFPMDYEIAMGEKIYASVLENQDIDSAKTKAINQFFSQLNIKTEYPIKITVVNDSVVNAFALPGGGIVVYDAILKRMEKPEDLAALLSHEFSHVELKHATRNVFRSLAGYLFISVLFSDVNGIAAIVVQNADNMRNLKYSRDLEHEADANGLEILKQNSLDPDGMQRLFEQLKKENTIEVSEWLSTHPDLDARISFVKTFKKDNPYTLKQNNSLKFYFDQLKDDTLSW